MNKNQNSKFRIALSCFIVFVIIFANIGVANILVDYALSRSGDGGNREVSAPVQEIKSETQSKIDANREIQYARNDAMLEVHPFKETEIKSDDGLVLKGYYIEQDNPSDLWMLGIHGYRSNHTEMISASTHYFDRNYNILLPDLRACGNSEGKYVGMGWLDRLDMLRWIDWIVEQNPNAKIVVQGESMGGATTMMLSGENPKNVVAFIEDCGYSSVWDIFSNELKLRFHMPEFPILYTASAVSKVRVGYSFKEASSVKQLKKSTKPVMFIHGDADDFVLFSNLQKNYDAKSGDDKKKIEVNGAGHCRSAYLLLDEYYDEVFAFIDQYMD